MDYETLGEHQGGDTGIFDFIAALPAQIFASTNFEFLTPKEAAAKHQPVAPLHVPYPISWADEERDVTAWLGNELQNEAFEELYKMKNKVNALQRSGILPMISIAYRLVTISIICAPSYFLMERYTNILLPTTLLTRHL